MKTSYEKEKKLNIALSKLKKLNFENPNLKNNIEKLSIQKNQLEIEKKELENRYSLLLQENESLKQKFDDFKRREVEEP